MEKTDHDLLIELNTTVKLMHESQMRMMTEHIGDDAKQFGETKTKVDAVHRRMDTFATTITDKIQKMISWKDRIVGGAIVVGALYSFAFGIFSFMKH